MKHRRLEEREEPFAHARRRQVFRLLTLDVRIQARRLRHGDRLEQSRAHHPIDRVARRDVVLTRAGLAVGLPERHHALNVRHRQRPHEQRVGEADRRGRRANPDREHEQRHRGEAGGAPQQPNAVDCVVHGIGVERQLPSEPRRVGKRAEGAANEVDVRSPRQVGPAALMRGAVVQLGLPLSRPLGAAPGGHQIRRDADDAECEPLGLSGHHDDPCGRSLRARRVTERGTRCRSRAVSSRARPAGVSS